ncbi:D-glycero-alpha-D-manno-heptose-1,7-bisphosphate 7-phosphatase [Nitrospinota bacterium]
MRRCVFLDRDGVLNRAVVQSGTPYPPAGLDELEILPGVAEACASLREAGFLLVVVTNQPDVARGSQSRDVVEAINGYLGKRLPIDDFRVCYHDDSDECACRKPKPGMLVGAAEDLGIDLSSSFMVGDRLKDIEAGNRAGCKTVLIESPYLEEGDAEADFRTSSLAKGAKWVIEHQHAGERNDEKVI